MGDIWSDMPTLVDASRGFGGFEGAAPQPLPVGAGIPSPYFPYEQQRGPPPSAFMQHSQSYSSSSPSSGYPWSSPPDSHASTLTPGWQATPMHSMPATPAPMFSGPPVGMMQAFVPVGVGPEGFPRSPNHREQEDTNAQWTVARYDEGAHRRPPQRSSTPHSQTLSLSSSPSSGGSLSRRPSLRGPGAEATKRPPREWRSDFSMNGQGFLGSLLTRSRSKSFGGGYDFLQPKVTLNAYIRYVSSKPPMHYDLRRDANTLRFRALEHPLTSWDLTRFACEPPLQSMRLVHAQLPWYVDVEAATNPAGVTLYDLFVAIQNYMLSPIAFGDFYNIEMNNDLRDQIAAAWAERCRTAEERNKGVMRVDYLMGKVIMEGVAKGRDGVWEIKTRKP